MTTPLEDLVAYRLERAWSTLEEARALAERNLWPGCVNRLYYACFYGVSGLLSQRGLSSAKHTGVRSFFNQHLVKSGEVPKELGQFYNEIFEHRQQGDYTDFARFEGTQVVPWLELAERFLDHISALSRKAPSPVNLTSEGR